MAAIATGAAIISARTDSFSGAQNNGGNGTLAVGVEIYDPAGATLSVTFGGEAMTGHTQRSGAGNVNVRWFTLETPPTGSQTLAVATFTNKRYRVWFVPTDDTGAVRDEDGLDSSSAATLACPAMTTEAGDLVLSICQTLLASDPTIIWSGDATQVSEAGVATGTVAAWGTEASFVADDTSAAPVCSWTGAANCALASIVLEDAAAPAGPTIDTQPVADTGLINGDPARRTTVYVCEASTADGGGITALDWFEDTDAISDGGIYDIVTTGLGTASATSTLTITRTVKTGTPFSMNARATDAAGGTDSDAVNDTWYTGPVLSSSSGTTDGSGVSTVGIVSDYANADGEFTVVTATAGAVTKQVSIHYEAP